MANDLQFELSYADAPFLQITPEVEAAIATRIPLSQLREIVPPVREWVGKNLAGVAFAEPPDEPNIVINQWFYPTGAARWGIFHGITTSYNMASMKALAYPAGSNTVVKLPFVIHTKGVSAQRFNFQDSNDAIPDTITTDLYMLPPRPITPPKDRVEESDDESPQHLWLITLVDERYYWQWIDGGEIACDTETATDTWANLIAKLVAALGITLSYDPIDAVYGHPALDSALYSNYENAAILLDAVAANVGCVVTRYFDGTYKFVKYFDAIQTMEQQRPLPGKDGGLATVAGGAIVDPDISTSDRARRAILPYSVTVTFPKVDDAGNYITTSSRGWIKNSYEMVYKETIVGSTVIFIAPADDWYFVGTQTIRDTCRAFYQNNDGTGNPVNQSTLHDLAVQITKDYYNSILASLDEVYPGILGWQPEGASDIIWTFRPDRPTTRVQRKPYNWGVSEMQHELSDVYPPGDPEDCSPIVTAVGCVNGQLSVTTRYIRGKFTVDDSPCDGLDDQVVGPPVGGNPPPKPGPAPVPGPAPIPPPAPPPSGGGTVGGGGGIAGGGSGFGGGVISGIIGGFVGTGVQVSNCLSHCTQVCFNAYGFYNPYCVNACFIACITRGNFGVGVIDGLNPINDPMSQSMDGLPTDYFYVNQGGTGLSSIPQGAILYAATNNPDSLTTIVPADGDTIVWASGVPTATVFPTGTLAVVANNDLTAQTNAATITTFTVGASDGEFLISTYITITTYGGGDSVGAQVTFTDETGTSRTNAFGTALTSATSSSLPTATIRAQAGSTITVATAGAFSATTYDAGGAIIQVR